MKPEFQKQIIKVTAKVAVILVISFLVFAVIILHTDNAIYKKQIEPERLRQDSLMAVKQLLDKEIFILQKELDSIKGQNKKLEQQLSKVKPNKK